jgi:DNA-binding response OmpR family regulator
MAGKFDLIVLDLMLPRLDGADICRMLRGDGITTPILMLTARAEEVDKILGLEIGADDYLTKPFSVREFTARIKAIFRRSEYGELAARPQALIQRGALLIDREKLKVTRDGQRLELTPKELDLLVLLASQPGRSFSRDQLLDRVWGFEFAGDSHTVNSHINRLRGKIEPNPERPSFILTTWGIGYRFTEEW